MIPTQTNSLRDLQLMAGILPPKYCMHEGIFLGKDEYKYQGNKISYNQAKEIKSVTKQMRESNPGAKDWQIRNLVAEEWDRRYPDFI